MQKAPLVRTTKDCAESCSVEKNPSKTMIYAKMLEMNKY